MSEAQIRPTRRLVVVLSLLAATPRRGGVSGNKVHEPLLLIGNEATNVWTESYAYENPARIIDQIDRVSAATAR